MAPDTLRILTAKAHKAKKERKGNEDGHGEAPVRRYKPHEQGSISTKSSLFSCGRGYKNSQVTPMAPGAPASYCEKTQIGYT
jgi:hypothetical protein